MSRVSWTRELVISKINDYNKNGVSLRSSNIQFLDAKLHSASRRYFGTWGKAVSCAGIDYESCHKNKTFVDGDTMFVEVINSKGVHYVMVDPETHLPGKVYINSKGYPKIKVNGQEMFLHNYIYNKTKEDNKVDHIDRNRLNAKISNLRELTNQQNQFNRDVKGYHLNKYNKYMSNIRVNGKQKYLGTFNTPEEARIAYLEAKLKYHGEEYSPLGTKEELENLRKLSRKDHP